MMLTPEHGQADLEAFSVDGVKRHLHELHDALAAKLGHPSNIGLLSSLSASDVIDMYVQAFMVNRNLTAQKAEIFEVLCRRHLKNKETPTRLVSEFKDIFLFLIQTDPTTLWGHTRSNPDDIGVQVTKQGQIEINRIFEFKLSSQAISFKADQKDKTLTTVQSLVALLNGSDVEVGPLGARLVEHARQRLGKLTKFPVSLAADVRYIYVLPGNETYKPNKRDSHLSVIHSPLNYDEIEEVRFLVLNFIQKHFKSTSPKKIW